MRSACYICDRIKADAWADGPDGEWIFGDLCYAHLDGQEFAVVAAKNDCLSHKVDWRQRAFVAALEAGIARAAVGELVVKLAAIMRATGQADESAGIELEARIASEAMEKGAAKVEGVLKADQAKD